ncbi:hypothetical protein [Lichenibacterium ramalinae]|nr:hypothetical protein [Lichenibacterium ramalinae]
MGWGRLRRLLSTVACLAVVLGALVAIGAGLSGIDRALADMPHHRI